MRLPLIDPAAMTPVQKALYDDMVAGIGQHFTDFKTSDPATGALIGPWNPMLHEPVGGGALWALSRDTSASSELPPRVREIAILVVGAKFNAAYEIYAHSAIAGAVGLTRSQIAALCAGGRPEGLNEQEQAAFDAATAVLRGGPLPEPCYRRLVEALGQHQANQLFFLVGIYCAVSALLNAYYVPVPEQQ